jgi:hypothetical protein
MASKVRAEAEPTLKIYKEILYDRDINYGNQVMCEEAS